MIAHLSVKLENRELKVRKPLVAMAAVVCLGAFASTADARTYREEVTPNNDKCYVVKYIPALYQVNTRGKKVSGESKSWVGEIADGAVVIKRRNPAVYIQTRKLLESDHYTLIPQGC